MDNAVEDGISKGRVLDLLMPLGNRQLRGKQTRGFAIAFIEQVQKIASLLC